MAVHLAPVKPVVVIYYQNDSGELPEKDARIREVKAGLEEEGIPCTVKNVPDGISGATALAYQGARDSQLSVGVGLSNTEIAIHYARLPEDQPLFLLSEQGTSFIWRQIGYNAARLVKGTPFKTDTGDAVDAENAENNKGDQAALAGLITQVVRQVLQNPAFAEAVRRW